MSESESGSESDSIDDSGDEDISNQLAFSETPSMVKFGKGPRYALLSAGHPRLEASCPFGLQSVVGGGHRPTMELIFSFAAGWTHHMSLDQLEENIELLEEKVQGIVSQGRFSLIRYPLWSTFESVSKLALRMDPVARLRLAKWAVDMVDNVGVGPACGIDVNVVVEALRSAAFELSSDPEKMSPAERRLVIDQALSMLVPMNAIDQWINEGTFGVDLFSDSAEEDQEEEAVWTSSTQCDIANPLLEKLLRFKVGDHVLANVDGQFRAGKIVNRAVVSGHAYEIKIVRGDFRNEGCKKIGNIVCAPCDDDRAVKIDPAAMTCYMLPSRLPAQVQAADAGLSDANGGVN
mmetsp:Transcript_88650/g.171662  ORF Transcript_88650/g.171662 Transcript_88650/m.171662 type:complete len:348 (-) Transcript_88650:44-1087(-)